MRSAGRLGHVGTIVGLLLAGPAAGQELAPEQRVRLTTLPPVTRIQGNHVSVLGSPVGRDGEAVLTPPGAGPTSTRVLSGRKLTGTVVAATSRSLLVRPDGTKQQLEFLRSDIRTLEVSRGKRTAAREGARAGALLGGSMGLLALLTSSGSICTGGCAAKGAAVLTAGGAAAGAIVGAMIRQEAWAMHVERDVEVGLSPAPRGIGANLTLRF